MPNWQVDERGYMALDDWPAKLSCAKSFGEGDGATSRKLREKRKYSQTHWLMIAAG